MFCAEAEDTPQESLLTSGWLLPFFLPEHVSSCLLLRDGLHQNSIPPDPIIECEYLAWHITSGFPSWRCWSAKENSDPVNASKQPSISGSCKSLPSSWPLLMEITCVTEPLCSWRFSLYTYLWLRGMVSQWVLSYSDLTPSERVSRPVVQRLSEVLCLWSGSINIYVPSSMWIHTCFTNSNIKKSLEYMLHRHSIQVYWLMKLNACKSLWQIRKGDI